MPFTPPAVDDIVASLAERFGEIKPAVYRGQTRIELRPADAPDALRLLKQLGFDLLVDITCVDYLDYKGAKHRYGLVYLLANTATNQRLTVRAYLDDPDPSIRSVVPLWEGANWLEREVWDLFGIRFEGHPDLRRLVMPEEFTAHPLRKDYPLQGRGERHNFPVLTRNDG
jgi:NADH-quinone oxidoreductase subunit C